MKPNKKSFLERGRWARPAITLTPAESPKLRALRHRRASLLGQLTKINAQLEAICQSL